jgi:hypothetical protein
MASFFGPVSYRVQASAAEVLVEVTLSADRPPRELLVYVRRLDRCTIQTVTMEGAGRAQVDAGCECVRVEAPAGMMRVRLAYAA